ncbi:disease resistance protein RPP13-like [Solanum tuberosum]|uniref:HJTR2GH1 protein n=1 Tax=Solanum tuberosum TaxID=4113 RepID=M1ATN9_SOLTU|nr:PREDICTED: disease resistance protein RPP13-like [Solanum tuberosum]
MADAVVSFAVQKLGDFLIQEVNLRLSLREDMKWMRTELLFMQSFLKDTELKQYGDHTIQQWVTEMNSIANDAVAILETYSLEAGKGASRLKACACICRKEKKFYNVAKEIQSLKQRIMDISRKRDTYSITNINSNAGEGTSNQVTTLRRTTSYVDDQDYIFVGLQDVVESLLAELLKAEPRRNVLSIHGMGGLGKTTLARNLYNSPNIVSSFPTRTWICVSQEYNTMDLFKTIIKSIQGCAKETLDLLEKMAETDLENHLRDLLEGCKYLVVVDDVWQKEAWESLKRAFPDRNNGSRVIITTRNQDVAERANNRGFVHKLRFLKQEESWDLFCRKLLDVRAMVPAMESLAKDMVEKCRGLPLAIVVLSGLLSHRWGLDKWQNVKDCLWKDIEEDSIEISYILSLSFNDLSAALKKCFLYFGVFPEDQVIDADDIMRLWMTEGFIIPRGEERMEDVAEGFLNELIRRSLVQVAQTFWEKVTVCRVHDLLRDLAIQKALEVNFFDIYDPRKNLKSTSCIRHAIHSEGERYLSSLDLSNSKLRSIMFFDPHICNVFQHIDVFRHIYVLYLDIDYGKVIPDAIGSLYNLKLLRLSVVSKIPSSIGNLKNLQTLVVVNMDRRFCQLPPETADLINLRHLVVPYSIPLAGISKLTSLQVLRLDCDQWKEVDPVDLVNLRELEMRNIYKSYSLNNISSLKNLNTLKLCILLGPQSTYPFPSLEFVNSCEKLQKLLLGGRLEKLPVFPDSITMIFLWESRLTKDPMPILGMLPNLRNLELEAAYEGEEIMCSDYSFSQLELLHLYGLDNLERWHLGTNAMPLIKDLVIHHCPKLREIPERMKDVKHFKRI